MSIRMLAIELYRAMKEVEGLEKKIESLPPGTSERDRLCEMLRVARNEEKRIRSLMEGAKGR